MSKRNWNWNNQGRGGGGGQKKRGGKGGRGGGGEKKPISVLGKEEFDKKLVAYGLNIPLTLEFFREELLNLEKNNPSPNETTVVQIQKLKEAISYGEKTYGGGPQGVSSTTIALKKSLSLEEGLTDAAVEVRKDIDKYIADRSSAITNIGPLISSTDNDLEKVITEYEREAEKTLINLKNIKNQMSKIDNAGFYVMEVVQKSGETINTLFEINKQLDVNNKQLQEENRAAIEMSNRPLVSTTGRLCKSFPYERNNKTYCKIEPYKTLFGSKDEDTVEQDELNKWEKRKERQTTNERIIFINFENVLIYNGRNVFAARTIDAPPSRVIGKQPFGRGDVLPIVTPSPSIPINTEFLLNYDNGKITGKISPTKIREFISDSAGWDFYNEIKKFEYVIYEFYDGELYATTATPTNIKPQEKEKEKEKIEILEEQTDGNYKRSLSRNRNDGGQGWTGNNNSGGDGSGVNFLRGRGGKDGRGGKGGRGGRGGKRGRG